MKERYMSDAEEGDVLSALEDRAKLVDFDPAQMTTAWEYEYMRHLAVFLIDTGCRFSEAFKFTVADGSVDLVHGETKNNQGRRVPLTARALAAAAFLLGSKHHAWLSTERTSKQAWEWCSHRWGVVTKAAGCPDVTLHILRHTCASRLVQRGVPIYTVTKWLGHSSVKVTERYAKLARGNLSQALSALEGNPTLAKGLLTRSHAVDDCVSTGHGTLKLAK
jgi:integrase